MNEKTLLRAMMKKKESNGSAALSATLRANKKQSSVPVKKEMQEESLKTAQPFHLLETVREASADPKVLEGPIVRCVLITEGLGNRNNMNYYSAEAIMNGVGLFEGKPCFLDHMSESEGNERPERTVKDKCGYFKNVTVSNDGGRTALSAELHFDLSESGKMAYAKALTAIHYKGEFPDSDQEYVGLSINANGLREKRTMQIGDETLEVNYVKAFTDVGSIDEVTTPARGGRFLAALVESAAGAIMQRKEPRMKLVKKLEAALSALTESLKDPKLSEETKTRLTESQKSVDALLQEAMQCAKESEAEEAEEESKEEASEESEEESEEGDDGGGDGVKPGHTITKTTKVKHEKNDDGDADDKDAQESKRGYIKALLSEAGIPKKLWNVDRLEKLSLKEAKSDIAEKKALIESVKETVKEQEFVSVGNGGEEFSESGNGSSELNGLFANLAD